MMRQRNEEKAEYRDSVSCHVHCHRDLDLGHVDGAYALIERFSMLGNWAGNWRIGALTSGSLRRFAVKEHADMFRKWLKAE